VLAIESRLPLKGELHSFYIDEALVVAGVPLKELDFPEGASVALIVRGDQLIAPKGSTVLQPDDHVYVIAMEEDAPLINLIFGRPEAE
jgi:cell volume regulation protein A